MPQTRKPSGRKTTDGASPMSAGLSSASLGVISVIPQKSSNPIETSRLEGRPVVRSPEQLRLHPALKEIGWTLVMDEFNEAARIGPSITSPILIAPNAIVLAGFGSWRLALFKNKPEIHCIEYALTEEESLHFILTHHQIRRGWNDFVRIRLAMTLEPGLQRRALDNMRTGGKHKGSAYLPEAQHIDVRQEIASAASVCPRNVSNVKTLLETAHPRLIEALRDGTLKINRAIQFCKLLRAEQLEHFIRYSEERITNKVIRQSTAQPKEKTAIRDVAAILDALRRQEASKPGSVAVRVGRHKQTVVLIGQDLFGGPDS
jgi:hypothetical protein